MNTFLDSLKFTFATLILVAFAQPALLAADLPRVTEVRVHCDTNTLIVTFTQPVQLNGDYALDHGALVLARTNGASPEEVLLTTTSLAPGIAYTLSISNVHDLEMPPAVLDPVLWAVGCVSGCGNLVIRKETHRTAVIQWSHAGDVLQAGTNLFAWADVPGATTPYYLTNFPPLTRFFRLRCQNAGGPAPVILRPPESGLVNTGDSFTFTVAAAGALPFGFQWMFQGDDLPEETNATLTVLNIGAAHVGAFQVKVSNPFGIATSAPGYLGLAGNTRGLALNTIVAQPPVAVLVNDTGGLPLNTVIAQPSVSVLLLDTDHMGGIPFNTALALPTVSVFLLDTNNTGGLPLNNTIAQPLVSFFLLETIRTGGLPFNTALAMPPVSVFLLDTNNPVGLR